MKKIKKRIDNNIVTFPKKINNGEREVEAIVFAASEPLDIDTIES
jgi:segregation and condensation protein B